MIRAGLFWTCLLGAALHARVAGAQQLPLRTGTPTSSCQFDTAAVQDTADYTMFLTTPRSVPGAAKRAPSYAPYVAAVASTFEPPTRLTLTYWPGTDSGEGSEATGPFSVCGPGEQYCETGLLDGEIEFRLKNRRVSGIAWRYPPDSPEAARALEEAIGRADSLGLFPAVTKIRGLPPGTVRLGLRLTVRQPLSDAVPVGKVRLPVIRATQPVAIIYQPEPQFPGAYEGANVIVPLIYIVEEDGRVMEGSIRALDEAHPVFAWVAKRAIALSRFRPAQAGGCPVRTMVQQRVVFRSR